MSVIQDYVTSASVVDQSIVQIPDVPSGDEAICLLQPYFAARGRDNVILEWKTPGDFLTAHGVSILNVPMYGQGGSNAYGFLRSGGRVMGCRLLPQDARIATLKLSVAIREKHDIIQYEKDANGAYILDNAGQRVVRTIEDPANPGTMIPVVASGHEMKIVAAPVTTFTAEGAPDPTTGITVVDGWTLYPLMAMSHYGRGKCGNNYGFSIYADVQRDKTVSDGRRYQFFIYEETEDGNSRQIMEEPIYFALNTEATFSEVSTISESLHLVYPETLDFFGDNPIKLTYFDANYELLLLALVNSVEGNLHDIDVLFARNKAGYLYDRLVINTESINLAATVLNLRNGHDGSLQLGNVVKDSDGNDITVTQSIINATKEQLLVDFYNCDTDVNVLDERIIDAAIVLDCIDYSARVKQTIATGLHKFRPDIFKCLCVGEPKTAREAELMFSEISPFIDGDTAFNTAVFAHSGITVDADLPRQYRMYSTYEVGRSLASLYQNNQYSILAGYNFGRIQYMKFDWLARKTKNDEIGRLIERKINFAQKLTKSGIISWMAEETLYDRGISKLNSMRNGLVVGDAIRTSKSILVKYAYDSRGATESMRLAEEELKGALGAKYPSGIVVVVRVYQTKRDALLENARCDITIYFPNIPKGFKTTVIAKRLDDLEGGN